jgi:hypothetical protein
MKTYTEEELKEILELHKKWLDDEDDGVKADLRVTDLSFANLSCTNLRFTDLRFSDLSSANLSSTDLRWANLRCTNLSSTDLRWTIGEMRSLKSFQIEKYMVSYTDSILNIGCESHNIEEWKNFDDKKIANMDDGALEWWTKWKTIIFQIIEMSPAEPTRYS